MTKTENRSNTERIEKLFDSLYSQNFDGEADTIETWYRGLSDDFLKRFDALPKGHMTIFMRTLLNKVHMDDPSYLRMLYNIRCFLDKWTESHLAQSPPCLLCKYPLMLSAWEDPNYEDKDVFEDENTTGICGECQSTIPWAAKTT